MDYIVELHKTNRKTIAFEIKEKGVLTVRAPFAMSDDMIQSQLRRHRSWIEKHMQQFQSREEACGEKYTSEELRQMASDAAKIIPEKVQQYAAILGVDYGRITIRNQKTRWGSCSAKGNLNFNCLLTQVPEDVMDYVIVHELCHRKEMNHSQRFWALVESVMPDYRDKKNWLKKNGNQLIARL